MGWLAVRQVGRKAMRFVLCLFLMGTLGIGITEFCLRVFVRPPFTIGYLRTHPTRRFELTPGFHGRSYDVDLDINSAGMRDLERPPDPDAYRVAVFGDSLAFGQGVKLQDIFPKQLERQLVARTNRRVQVFNFATPGFNTVAEVSLLLDVYAGFSPDLVVFQYSVDDDSVLMGESACNRFAVVRSAKDVLRRFYAYDYLARRYYGLKSPPDEHPGDNGAAGAGAFYNESYPGWVACQHAFVELAQFAGEHRFDVAFAVFAYDGHVAPSPDTDAQAPLVAKVFGALDRAGLPHHYLMDDALRAYAGRESELQVHEGDIHFSAAGHHLLASFLAEKLAPNMRR